MLVGRRRNGSVCRFYVLVLQMELWVTSQRSEKVCYVESWIKVVTMMSIEIVNVWCDVPC